MNKSNSYFDGPVWNWFGLSYSSYLVVPRALLCGMPEKWQRRFVKLLAEAERTYDDTIEDKYTVTLRDERGRFKHDPLSGYAHPPLLPYRIKDKAAFRKTFWGRLLG